MTTHSTPARPYGHPDAAASFALAATIMCTPDRLEAFLAGEREARLEAAMYGPDGFRLAGLASAYDRPLAPYAPIVTTAERLETADTI